MQKDVHEKIKITAQKIAESMGATAEVSIETKTLVTYNTPELVEKMLPSLEKSIGKENVLETNWITGAEDFSYYRLKAPAFFFQVGGMPKGKNKKDAAPHHTPDFYIDDSRFDVGIKAFCNIVFDYQPSAKTARISNDNISADILSQQVSVENYFPKQLFDLPFQPFGFEFENRKKKERGHLVRFRSSEAEKMSALLTAILLLNNFVRSLRKGFEGNYTRVLL